MKEFLFGTVNEEQEVKCMRCKNKVGTNGKPLINFCDNCGNPLNLSAMKLHELEIDTERKLLVEEIKARLLSGEDINIVFGDYLK